MFQAILEALSHESAQSVIDAINKDTERRESLLHKASPFVGRVAVCALRDQSRFADPSRNLSFYEVTQTYRLPVVVEENENKVEDVAKLAPEAGYLLTTAFPYLTLREADDILTETEGPGGGFLDDGSSFGVYSRLDLYKAGEKAVSRAPQTSQPGVTFAR
jgi:hypothetical protein